MDPFKSALESLLPGGKGVWVPMDHGLTSFPVKGIERIDGAIDDCIEAGVDAIVLQKGVLSHQAKRLSWPNFIMHVSASTVHAGANADKKVPVGTVEEAVRRGAIGISCQVNLGSEGEAEMVKDAGHLTTSALPSQMPVLGMIYPRGQNLVNIEGDATKGVAHAARLAWELGCQVAKVPWTGSAESFHDVCSSVPIPVLIAGGKPNGPFVETLDIVESAISAGGAGVCMGRQIFCAPDRIQRIRALRAIIHEGKTSAEAIELMG